MTIYSNVIQFARDALKIEMKGREKIGTTSGGKTSWRRFKHMYHVGNDIDATDDIDSVIDGMSIKTLDGAMQELGYRGGSKL